MTIYPSLTRPAIYLWRFCLLIALLSGTFELQAQGTIEDVVYLKNGSILRGHLTEKTKERIKIELQGGSIFVFTPQEVDSVKKENALKERIRAIKKDYFRRDRGFRNMTELSIIYGTNLKNTPNNYYYYNNNGDDFGLSLHTVNGYQAWPYLFAGAGLGIDRYISFKQTFSPFYLRLATEFLKRKVTPYVFGDVGYAVMWKQKPAEGYAYLKNKGGLYASAGGGIRIYTRSLASVLLSVSYRRTQSETNYAYIYDQGSTYHVARTYQRIAFNIGVTF